MLNDIGLLGGRRSIYGDSQFKAYKASPLDDSTRHGTYC